MVSAEPTAKINRFLTPPKAGIRNDGFQVALRFSTEHVFEFCNVLVPDTGSGAMIDHRS
jgi:hypothetical protein